MCIRDRYQRRVHGDGSLTVMSDHEHALCGKWLLRGKIGEGAFSTVYRAHSVSNRLEKAAVKVINKKKLSERSINLIKGEVGILSSLSHGNIVKLMDSRESESFLYLVMELVEGGTLKQAMDLRRKEGFGFTDDEIASIMKSLLNAVDYLHAKNIVHRDLKPENILISDPRNPSTLKVADFGLSLQHNHQPLTTHCGTLAYMAPELAIDHLYGKVLFV
eukprot:TRINITY_DN2064_c0_g2_i12.p1 TRINITY_DN2064_c0_g2~~TRINITY_DN2064_c0_g2_i12.p1  ORF type:complete len:238 (+),score=25.81 TRINITY_DN2064_c0_g2_i12:63-716(+)